MEKKNIKKILLFAIPMTICNLRCHYCYLSQREEFVTGVQPEMHYTPEQIGYALRPERIGGYAYCNFCADGETMLVKDIDKYIYALVSQGHYAEIVSNMTISSMLDKFLAWGPEILKRVEFKCSFHYLELKKRGLLELFADNVNRAWRGGASVNIELVPSDELIPILDEVKAFSMEHFGALPHLTIARDDRTEGIDYLTELPMEEYDRVWSQLNSDFWRFKKTIFGVPQKHFCYAGQWSCYINITNGYTTQCYCGKSLGNVFENPDEAFPEMPIGKCEIAHCYNGHMFMTWGLIPGVTKTGYGDIRDRERTDGTHWLQPELKEFFNTKLCNANKPLSVRQRAKIYDGYYQEYFSELWNKVRK